MNNTVTVSEITKYIKNMFTQDFVLNSVKVCGEVSNCKYHTSGHIYFTLKDEKSSIACVMFASDRIGLSFTLSDGAKVEIEGRIDIYERSGAYQLYAKKIKKEGAGELYLRYEALKKELEERGMFADEYKTPIPKYIRTLGVVTAPTGAAVRDIINIATRRNPYVQIILAPAKVQGDGAAQSIVNAIHELERQQVDVMIVGRGGGSIEDLWAFNEEIVAQAVFDTLIPVISAVGHETDFTITDFVADMRAPTPSAAAEIAVYEAERLSDDFADVSERLTAAMYDRVRRLREALDMARVRLKAAGPEARLIQQRTYSMNLEERLEAAFEKLYRAKRHALEMYIARLKGLSPLDKLSQGYSVACTESGARIHSIEDVTAGARFKLYVSDGYIDSVVESAHSQTL